jgi:hypothetical protein
MFEMNRLASERLTAFENAACCFDRGLLAAREAVIAENSGREIDRDSVLLDIAAVMQPLKSEGKSAIGFLATSHSAEHRAMAEGCRTRLAHAVNLRRAASRCIRQGIVPPLPELLETASVAKETGPGAEAWQTTWTMVWVRAWYLPWTPAWT